MYGPLCYDKTMKIDILTLFPKMFDGPFSESIISRAVKKGLISIKIHNLRDWAKDKHKTVDDSPYGGGAGMVIRVDIIDKAISTLKFKAQMSNVKTILLTPTGKLFNQKIARSLSRIPHLILICGHYEGFDARVEKLVDEQISIGDYVLTGGELPAAVIVDTITRLLPGVVGKKESIKNESFSKDLLDYPAYTRPEKYRGMRVPKILLSGDHKKIEQWRKEQSIKTTKKLRKSLCRAD